MTALIYNHGCYISRRCIGKRKISSRSKKFFNLRKLNFWKQTKEKLKSNIIIEGCKKVLEAWSLSCCSSNGLSSATYVSQLLQSTQVTLENGT